MTKEGGLICFPTQMFQFRRFRRYRLYPIDPVNHTTLLQQICVIPCKKCTKSKNLNFAHQALPPSNLAVYFLLKLNKIYLEQPHTYRIDEKKEESQF